MDETMVKIEVTYVVTMNEMTATEVIWYVETWCASAMNADEVVILVVIQSLNEMMFGVMPAHKKTNGRVVIVHLEYLLASLVCSRHLVDIVCVDTSGDSDGKYCSPYVSCEAG